MKRIVILGGGFAGIHAAQKIGRFIQTSRLEKKYEVILVDRNEHHTYTPLLYETATTSKEIADMRRLHDIVTLPIRKLLKRIPTHMVRGDVQGLRLDAKAVLMKDQSVITFDYLLIALGAETNDFGIPGIKEYGLMLKTFKDAIAVRDRIWNYALEGREAIRIVIGGAGSTGVELAGEIKALCGHLERTFPKCTLETTILEAAPQILPGFDPRVVERVTSRLRTLEIHIMTKRKITVIQAHEVLLDNRTALPYDIFVWTGGIKVPTFLESTPFLKGKSGRLMVTEKMECVGPDTIPYGNMYAAGDIACFIDPKTQNPVPQVARAAISEGSIAAKNIVSQIAAKELGQKTHAYSFRPMQYPYVIPVGGRYAVLKFGPIVISGLVGWILKGLVELNYLLSIMPFLAAIRIWLAGLKITVQNDRLR